jgi:hypothetical protein
VEYKDHFCSGCWVLYSWLQLARLLAPGAWARPSGAACAGGSVLGCSGGEEQNFHAASPSGFGTSQPALNCADITADAVTAMRGYSFTPRRASGYIVAKRQSSWWCG